MASASDSDQRLLTIVGAGTMGSGIALAGLLAGWEVRLQDVSKGVLQRAEEYLRTYLARKGELPALERATLTTKIGDLAGPGVWLEAVPEEMDLKMEVLRQMDGLAEGSALLATNTSTLPVTALASATGRPGRVVGMHFFNPPAILPLVEIVRTAASEEGAVERAVATAEDLGKTPVVVTDSPGFIVNRVARPFYGEGLRILGEGGAEVPAIDAIVESAGFPMGPFHLMDLIGLDVNLAAGRSVYEQMFHEPRFRPHPLQQRMVEAGLLGRKAGGGFYGYDEGGESMGRLELEAPEISGEGTLRVVPGRWDRGVSAHLREAGFELTEKGAESQAGFVLAGREGGLVEALAGLGNGRQAPLPIFCQLNDVTWSEAAQWVEEPDRLVGFDALFFSEAKGTCLVGADRIDPEMKRAVETLVEAAGRSPIWMEDRPGLILSRIVTALVNEACFAVEGGVADAETIDRAMRLGVSYPKGPLAWGREIGWPRVLAVLEHLHREYGESRYRPAAALRRRARRTGQSAPGD